MELIMSTNMRKWLPTNEITISELEETVNRKVDELLEKRDELNDRKIKIRENLEAMRDVKEDERITPSFFRRMGTSIKKEKIYILRDGEKDGEETTEEEEINKICTRFYQGLWKNRRGTRDFSERRLTNLLNNIDKKISDQNRGAIDGDITLEEVLRATKELAKNKAPGIDGIPAEFFQENEHVTKWLHKIILEAEKEKQLPESQRTSVVKLLFKKGDRKQIENYRPLSLACTDYKILAKVITNRIRPTLREIIGTEQQGFVDGGDIIGNVILVKEIIEYCNETDTEAYVLMMDFKKAYDRVDRETIEQTMRKMNYGENILKLIKLLYTGSQATIITNEMKGENFKTKGGVKQGCPLSPYLFIIALELMAIEIRKEKAIKGIELANRNEHLNSVSNKNRQPDNINDRISLIADDSSTIITDINQISVVRENRHQCEKRSGSELHEGKTKII